MVQASGAFFLIRIQLAGLEIYPTFEAVCLGCHAPGLLAWSRAPLSSRRGEEPWARDASGTSDSVKSRMPERDRKGWLRSRLCFAFEIIIWAMKVVPGDTGGAVMFRETVHKGT